MKHKTKTGKLLLAITLALLLLLSLAIGVSAEEPTTAEVTETTAAVTTAAEADTEEDATLSGTVSDLLREHSAPLLSGATFLLTLAISLLFKRRVIPTLLEALTAILGKSREAVGAMTEGYAEERAELAAVLARAEELLAKVSASAEAAEIAAEAVRQSEDKEAALARILTEQSALLYELLMSANLPQYQKDRIGEAHAAMQRALAEGRHD